MLSETQERLMQSVARQGYRVTVGDVAADLGLPVEAARRELNLMASQAGGSLQVAETGDIAYQFTAQWQDILRQKEQNAQWQAFWKSTKKTLLYLGRISFGIMLILSLLIIAFAFIVISTAGNRDDRNNNRSNNGGGFGGMYWFWYGFSPFDLFYYGPDREQERRLRYERGEPVGFLEGVFSFLFGDGDPNADLEERRWQLVARTIASQRGVVAGEQVIPYLDGAFNEREDYMLPVLVKFDGQPEVSDDGNLVYQFPQFQVSAQAKSTVMPPVNSYLEEQPWEFSKAPSSTLLMAAALGVANLVGAAWLWSEIPRFGYYLERLGYGWLVGVAPFLLIYGILFITVPAVRYALLGPRNEKINQRNGLRRERAVYLSRPDERLRTKLKFAQQFANRKVLGQDSVYDSGKALIDQRDLEGEDFDKRLKG